MNAWLAVNGDLDGAISAIDDAYDAVHEAETLEDIRIAFDALLHAVSEAQIEAAAVALALEPAPVQEQRGEQEP